MMSVAVRDGKGGVWVGERAVERSDPENGSSSESVEESESDIVVVVTLIICRFSALLS